MSAFARAAESASGGWLRFPEPQPLDAPALAMLWSRDGVLPAHSRQLALLVDGGR